MNKITNSKNFNLFFEKLIKYYESEKKVKISLDYLKKIFSEIYSVSFFQGITDWKKLYDVITILRDENLIKLPKSEKSYHHTRDFSLPEYIILIIKKKNGEKKLWKQFKWHPELSHLTALDRLSNKLFQRLKVVDNYLKNLTEELIPISEKERSLQIFGDEKALKSLLDYFEKRPELNINLLKMLHCFRTFEPLVGFNFPKSNQNKIIFIENRDTFLSMSKVCFSLHNPPYVGVFYGQGLNFKTCVLSIPYHFSGDITIEYFGDIDYTGFAIPHDANVILQKKHPEYCISLSSNLYEKLAELAKIDSRKFPAKDKPNKKVEFSIFSNENRKYIKNILEGGYRVPQELLNLEELFRIYSDEPIPQQFKLEHFEFLKKLYKYSFIPIIGK